ncbi:MAG: ETC complex I subunit [Parvularculaceae bacterium]
MKSLFARIYRPSKTAMQSGKAKSHSWVLEFEQRTPRRIDPLMGWTGSTDMLAGEVRLYFDDKASAIAYAKKHGIPHQVIETPEPRPVPKSYSENFAFRRRQPWTH